MTATTPDTTTVKPTIGQPEHHPAQNCDPEYCDADCVNCTEGVGWDLSFGSRINFGPQTVGGPLRVFLSLSDDAIDRGMVHREVTPTQIIQFARHLLELAKGPGDIETSVAKLNETIAQLDEHIYAKADEIAAERIAADKARLEDVARRAQGDLNLAQGRHMDLVAEFRRQIAALERNAERYRRMLTEAGVDWRTGLPLPAQANGEDQ